MKLDPIPKDFDNRPGGEPEEYYMDGFEAAKKRIIAILERFPLQTAALTMHLKHLHPSQPLIELGEKFE